jgi:hypothetical protein
MRRIINSTYMTLDGVVGNPCDWPPPGGRDPRAAAIHTELLAACDAVLLAGCGDESFTEVWPDLAGDRIEGLTRHVVVDDDPVPTIRRFKEQPGGDIAQFGFGRLAHTLLAHALLDEVNLWMHPVFLGGGSPTLLHGGGPTTQFELVDSQVLDTGVVVLTYERLAGSDGAPS